MVEQPMRKTEREIQEGMARAYMELLIIFDPKRMYGPRSPNKPCTYRYESGFGPAQDQAYWEYRNGTSTRSIF